MRIVTCYPVTPSQVDQIRRAAPRGAEVVDAGQERIAQEILAADIYCGHAKVPIDWETVVAQRRLRWIQSSAAGIDHCLVPPVVASDILVTSASGLFARQVGEHALALMLGILRGLPNFFRAQQQRSFVRQPTGDLRHKIVGICGFGGNGREIARLLHHFDTRILATDVFPIGKPPYVEQLWPPDRLPDLLQLSDILVLCVPLTSTTSGMIGRPEFQRMKPTAMVINMARGPVVNESALIEALAQGRIVAAGLDVTETEPLPPESPLWSMPQVIITPHVGAQAADRNDRVTTFFCENLARFQAGQPLKNLVDKQTGLVPPSNWRCEIAANKLES